jgi:hypothetical membrane protein
MFDSLIRIISGQFEQNELYVHAAIQFSLFFLCLLIAWCKYPKQNSYSMTSSPISHLGSWAEVRNPKGWYFFSISMLISSVMDIPHALYFYQQIKSINPNLALLEIGFNFMGLIGTFFIGVFPDVEKERVFGEIKYTTLHGISAIMSIMGYVLTILCRLALYIFERSDQNNSRIMNKALVIPIYVYYICVICFLINSIIYLKRNEREIKKNDEKKKDMKYDFQTKGMKSFPLWEWITFISNTSILYWWLLIV